MIEINEKISIPEEELTFTASRSSGPGGQHVNKVSTRMTLCFDVVHSPSLSPGDKERIASRLGNRMDRDGVLHIVSQSTRSQLSNRGLAVERFVELLQSALKELPARKKTRIGKAAKLRRLEDKKQRSRVKQQRSKKLPLE